MKLTKLILIFFLACSLQPVACGLIFAAGEDITVVGDTKAKTVSLDSVDISTLGSGSEGEIRYNSIDEELYVWDGTQWKPLSANKNVATKIVGVDRDRDGQYDAGDSLDAQRADYICDGTDDQQEINQAILDIIYSATTPVNKSKQGIVYLLDGTYNISDKISPDLAYTRPDTGGLVTIATPGIVINPTAVAQSGISLIGAGAGTVLQIATSIDGITASNVTRILISQLTIYNGIVGISFNSVTLSKINNVWMDGAPDEYIYALTLDNSNSNIISNNIFRNKGYCLVLTNSANNIISGNICKDNALQDIVLGTSNNNIISGNHIGPSGGYGLMISSSNNNTISANDIQRHWMAYDNSASEMKEGIGIRLYSSSGNAVSGNNIQENAYNGISMESSSNNNVISANLLYSNGKKVDINCASINVVASNNNNLTGNLISDDGNFGIWIKGNSDNNLISSFSIGGSTADGAVNGIKINSSLENDNYLVANYIDGVGFTAAKISDSGTGTKYTGKEKITLERASGQNPGSGGTITPGAASYIPFDPNPSYTLSTTTAIANGKADGDLLILENLSASTITIPNSANTKLGANRTLGIYDNMVLIWKADIDSAKSNWLELSYQDN
ncbi:MAG: right-handed parallel beta-helix repeat-containing protein [Candidatus Omnitrophota bacterium]|nr:right-handed parallel beta-helix repeat-containing protein [Candidatus Omnitrophota bacterium]